MHTSHPRRTSEVLQAIIDHEDDGLISLGEFTEMLGERAFALVILVLALPNSLPIPGIPGVSTITGLPVAFIALQMLAGKDSIWLPEKMRRKQFSQATLKRLLMKAMPGVIWVERYLCPRLDFMCFKFVERLLGLLFMVLALIISLPIPGGNFLPGISMALLALGLLERDGLFVLCSAAFSLMSIALMYKVIGLAVSGAVNYLAGLF